MKNLTWQNPEQLFVAQELINKVKSKCCGIKVPITPAAFIEDALVTIDLLSTVPTATVVVKDAEGKVVYSSTEWNVDKINIDLTSEQKGKYTLEIQLPTEVFSGEFELEN